MKDQILALIFCTICIMEQSTNESRELKELVFGRMQTRRAKELSFVPAESVPGQGSILWGRRVTAEEQAGVWPRGSSSGAKLIGVALRLCQELSSCARHKVDGDE